MTGFQFASATTRSRADAAKRFVSTLSAAGLTASSEPGYSERSITLRAEKGPYRVSCLLDGKSHNTSFLSHWNVDHKTDLKFPPELAFVINGSVNAYHGCKATGFHLTLENLLTCIVEGFEKLEAAP